MKSTLSRRALIGSLPLWLTSCAGTQRFAYAPFGQASHYGPILDEPFPIPAVDVSRIHPDLLRQEVPFRSPYRPGTIVVRVAERRLYLVQPGGRAVRYGVGVGREEALNFQGAAVIGRKAEWPTWTPTENMMRRIPRYRAYAGGMPGGPGNPLGARALYLYRDNQDTYFRLHGTHEPETIGQAVSSGCIRLLNHDIIDLYDRVPVGTRVVVIQGRDSSEIS